MTPIKCPRCGLTNWSTDLNCIGCEFIFQPEMPQAIQKPEQPLPEFSFADFAKPDEFLEFLPSHSRTPQMTAKIATTRKTAEKSRHYTDQDSQTYNSQTLPKTGSFYRQPIEPAAVFVKCVSDNNLQQMSGNSENQTKSKNNLIITAIILGTLGFFAMMFLAGLVIFLNRSLFM